jgi:SpoVK/Ycf46/Vps4 family AAA+-type ATPase
VAENIDIIEIKEGCGDRESAISYIRKLASNLGQEVGHDEIKEILPEKQIFTVGEAYEIYANWYREGLKSRIYKSYRDCAVMQVRKEEKKSSPYNELQKMVGLAEIKKVVDEVIDSARIQKLRSEMGMDSYKTSLHMVFTGNPGSAKTTVARLIAQIFVKEGILRSGKFVECGRADLVGKYVGWTAKTVREKFREARGGILFIDEAYSLVDDTNSYGDEAINTIVQEMENNRENVIVIFAGYPQKMEEFLTRNEGLRSRIAFHLDFPDYNADELLEILKLMVKHKGYCMDKAVYDRCYGIFEEVCQREEFGNGRFVRNLLEQAMMSQSSRIIRENKGKKVSRKTLKTLKIEDFDVNISKQLLKDRKNPIGFAI